MASKSVVYFRSTTLCINIISNENRPFLCGKKPPTLCYFDMDDYLLFLISQFTVSGTLMTHFCEIIFLFLFLIGLFFL